MALILRNFNIAAQQPIINRLLRQFSISSTLQLKEIQVQQENEKLSISAVTVPSPREPYLLPAVKSKPLCPTCDLGLDIKHTDVLILSQYVRSDGCMLPRRVTGLCKTQQKRIGTMVTMAQKAGLMSNLGPAWSKKDPKRRYQWRKYNKYFDETTIRV